MTDRIFQDTIVGMPKIQTTLQFERWFAGLRDVRAKARIDIRIRRLREGNPGDVKPVGGGISELRLAYGPGYRIYYINTDEELILLLSGGGKASQSKDIERAKDLVKNIRKNE